MSKHEQEMLNNKIKNNLLSDIVIYKILTQQEWELFQNNGYFEGSQLDKKSGFIHTSFENQYPKIITKFFNKIRPLFLVKINTKLLAADCLKIEPNQPGGDKYPHIYGDIPFNSVVSYEVITKDEIGLDQIKETCSQEVLGNFHNIEDLF